MTPEIDLSKLTVAEKDALILSLLPLVDQLAAALARIAELEKRLAALERPPKTPDNSSMPPSKGQKSNRPTGNKPPRKSRPGFGRALEPNPIASSMPRWTPARIAPPASPPRSRRHSECMTAWNCHPSSPM